MNDVGDYVVFPALWWHHGFFDIKSKNKVVITAQLFAIPSKANSSQRTKRTKVEPHIQGYLAPSIFNGLTEDLFSHWDNTYSVEKFPPASKFLGPIDKSKNRHIQSHQICQVPKIEQLVFAFEELFADISVDSVWLMKKERDDDGFQEWHQDIKNRITKTIVINLGSGLVLNEEQDEQVKGASASASDTLTLRYNKDTRIYFYSVDDGWKHVIKMKKKPKDDSIHCYFNCKTCTPEGTPLGLGVVVGNDHYIQRHTISQCWYSAQFCTSFLILVHHHVHTERPNFIPANGGVTMALTPYPRAEVQECEVEKLPGIANFVTVAYARSHFAVLLYDLPSRNVLVYDGLNMSLTSWKDHIIHTLKKYGLQRWDETPDVKISRGSQGKGDELMELCYSDFKEPWHVVNDPILKQSDGFNCGPIACLKVMEIYGIIPMNSIAEIAHQDFGYRGVVMKYYQEFISKYKADMQFNISKGTAKKLGKLTQVQVSKEYKLSGVNTDEEEDDKEEQEEEEDNAEVNLFTSIQSDSKAVANLYTSMHRRLAMEKKNNKQAENAERAMKQCGNAALQAGISPGAVVTLKVDYRTFFNPEGLVAIVYGVNPRTGAVKVCCEHGVITHNGEKDEYWVPADGYLVKAKAGSFFPLSNELEQVQKLVEDGMFTGVGCPRISYSKMHQQQIGANSPLKKAKGCGCKNGKGGSICGCRRKKQSCHSTCSCNGNCRK